MDELIAESRYSVAMGFSLLEHGAGEAVIGCVVRDDHLNTRGFCHGGVISGLMDMAAGIAVKARLDDRSKPVATVALAVNYQRPARLGDELRARARVQNGRRVVSTLIEVSNQHGDPIASGLATLHVG